MTVVSLPAGQRQVITLGTGRRIADRFLQFGRVSLLIDGRDDAAARNAEPARVIINANVDDARATARHLGCLGVTWLAEAGYRQAGGPAPCSTRMATTSSASN